MAAVVAALLAWAPAIYAAPGGESPARIHFDIAAQPLSSALLQFSDQAHVQVTVAGEVVNGRHSAGVRGEFGAAEALLQILNGTGLVSEFVGERAVAIRAAATTSMATDAESESGSRPDGQRSLHLAQSAGDTAPAAEPWKPDARTSNAELEEVVVTGSHIRGGPVGSPITTLTREMIDRSGYASTQQLIQSLPQNYGGDAAEDVINSRNGFENTGGGTGVNLRGLGASATLVLLNGRRMPQAGGQSGTYVDISSIPLTAIDRVEILTDGASAIYGSDAIAGVVNFVLRKNLDGADTTLRFGDSTRGGGAESQIGQTLGTHWSTGRAMLAYELYHREPVASSQRELTKSADLRPFGGTDHRVNAGNPGTIVSPVVAGIPRGQNGTQLTPDDLSIGTPNLDSSFNTGWDNLFRQNRHSAFLTAEQEIGPDVTLFTDVLYANRRYDKHVGGVITFFQPVPDTNPYFVSPVPGADTVYVNYSFLDDFGVAHTSGTVESIGSTVGARWNMTDTWRSELYVSWAWEKDRNRASSYDPQNLMEAVGYDDPATAFNPAIDGYFNLFADGSNTPRNVIDFVRGGVIFDLSDRVRTAGLRADGALFALPAGDVQVAVGVEARDEVFARSAAPLQRGVWTIAPSATGTKDRNVLAGFAELRVPVVSSANRMTEIEDLALSAAVRAEDYNDFGSTVNPKLGFDWRVLPALSFKGSWGKSFRAPTIENTMPQGQFIYPNTFADLTSPTGTTFGLYLQNANPNLTPEKSTSTSFTAQLEGQGAWSPRARATWYRIDFKDQIGTLPGSFEALNSPLYAPYVVRNPSRELVESYLNSPYFLKDLGTPNAEDIEVIIDARYQNISTTRTDGIDLNVSAATTLPWGRLTLQLDANRILSYELSLVEGSPVTSVNDQYGYPPDFSARGSATLEVNRFSLTGTVSYTDDYEYVRNPVTQRVSSWTRFDMLLSYDVSALLQAPPDSSRITLAVQNVFDKDPPFVDVNYGFDAANADVMGRFVSLQARHRW